MSPRRCNDRGLSTMRFEKWQALGNDYVITWDTELPWPLTPARIRRICEPHTGLAADGILLLARSDDPEFVADLRIFNPDGSEAALSGNGVREAVLYLRRAGFADRDEFAIRTPAGPIRPRITGANTCAVDMGRAATTTPEYPSGPPNGRGELTTPRGTFSFQHVSIGNPQCAIEVPGPDDLAALDLTTIGPGIEVHDLFPNRTNVSWYCPLEPGVIRARIFERGVGETLSSGTGASGAAVAHRLRGGPDRILVVLDGGELEIDVDDKLSVILTGWAVPVYHGALSRDLIKELDATQ
jgi:diaminopimelate epimerase